MTPEMPAKPQGPRMPEGWQPAGNHFALGNGRRSSRRDTVNPTKEQASVEAERATRNALMDCYNG